MQAGSQRWPTGFARLSTKTWATTWRLYTDALPSLQQGVSRMERFLGLVALLSLLLGGVGAAQTTRAWLATRMDAIAILRCLGLCDRVRFCSSTSVRRFCWAWSAA